MRPLTEEETRTMFQKLAKYIGENIQLLVDRPDGTYCFRLHNERVYYVSEKILKLATNISGDKLVSLGTCFGKFTKTQKFRLHITALDYLAPYAKYKVWVKPGAEQSFLYGNHILKSGLGRITENTAQYQGLVVYSMADVPLGFGVAAKSTQECRKVDPLAIVVFHQADIGDGDSRDWKNTSGALTFSPGRGMGRYPTQVLETQSTQNDNPRTGIDPKWRDAG
uniref:60S ribosome subunit biogenesis protein NIP7 homolog n=1 Tax=Ornithorhynchus anatinus TaxID=9258 RepID=F6ZQP1_ORNAN